MSRRYAYPHRPNTFEPSSTSATAIEAAPRPPTRSASSWSSSRSSDYSLFGPGLAIGINTTLLASLMYRSRLAPRPIATIGLIGGPVVLASSVAVLFGAYGQTSAAAALAAMPVTAWEISLAGWMIAKGLKSPRVLDYASRPVEPGSPAATLPSY